MILSIAVTLEILVLPMRSLARKEDHFIENKLHEYLDALDIADTVETLGLDPEIDNEKIREKITRLNERKQKYKKLEKELKETGQEQISTSDPDSRKLEKQTGHRKQQGTL